MNVCQQQETRKKIESKGSMKEEKNTGHKQKKRKPITIKIQEIKENSEVTSEKSKKKIKKEIIGNKEGPVEAALSELTINTA
jgi:hypothetical protein